MVTQQKKKTLRKDTNIVPTAQNSARLNNAAQYLTVHKTQIVHTNCSHQHYVEI